MKSLVSSATLPSRFRPLCLTVAILMGIASPLSAVEFTLMSFNVWKQGSQVDDGFAKEISAIRLAKTDVVCLQESTPEHAGKVAQALGWFLAEKGTGTAQIVSRHRIVETYETVRCVAARIRISDEPLQEVMVFNCHLDHRFYGPYAARVEGASAASVQEEESRSDREEQMTGILRLMAPFLEKSVNVPVFLTGDFNCPSHLDWTAATSGDHGGVGPLPWPVSSRILAAGMTDSFRSVHPDPVAEPGNSWSTIHKTPEPQDRIDFIHHAGKGLELTACRMFATAVERTVGSWSEGRIAEVAANTWPSDHFSVIATWQITRGTGSIVAEDAALDHAVPK